MIIEYFLLVLRAGATVVAHLGPYIATNRGTHGADDDTNPSVTHDASRFQLFNLLIETIDHIQDPNRAN